MNKLKTTIISFFLICVISVLAGCNNNNLDTKNEVNSSTSITLKGSVTINANAIPSQLEMADNSRAAMFSGDSVLALDVPSFTVTATQSKTGYKLTGEIESSGSDYYYYIVIPSAGDWSIKIQVNTQNGMAFSGSGIANIEYSSSSLSGYAPSIVLMPVQTPGETGSINLKVKTSLQQDNSGSYTVKWLWDTNNKPAGVADAQATMSYAQGSESDAFAFSDVPAGSYKVTIQFFDNNSKLLYSCGQWITVFGNLTTDSWYGEGPQYEEDSNEKIWLSLTQTAVTEYAKYNSDVSLAQNPTVLYKKVQSDEYQIMLVDGEIDDNLTFTATSPSGITTANIDTPYFTNIFCYGNNGTTYIFVEATESSGDNAGALHHFIYEIKSDNTTNWYEFVDSADATQYKDYSSITALYFDKENSQLYAIILGDALANGSFVSKLFKLTLNSDNTITATAYPEMILPQEVTCFAVTNGNLYIPVFQNGWVKLQVYQLTANSVKQISSLLLENFLATKYEIDKKDVSHVIEITDMICQNNSLFILVNDNYNKYQNVYSRGGILKYDLFSNTTNAQIAGMTLKDALCGEDGFKWPMSTEHNDSLTPVSYTCFSSDTKKLYYKYSADGEPAEYSEYVATNSAFTSFYSPYDEDSLQFFGPRKFISYNEEEFLIADSGYVSYVTEVEAGKHESYSLGGERYDDSCTLTFAQVNRVVKVNAADLTIDSVTDVSDKTVAFTACPTYLMGKTKVIENYPALYTYNGTDYVEYNTGNGVFTYIPKKQD